MTQQGSPRRRKRGGCCCGSWSRRRARAIGGARQFRPPGHPNAGADAGLARRRGGQVVAPAASQCASSIAAVCSVPSSLARCLWSACSTGRRYRDALTLCTPAITTRSVKPRLCFPAWACRSFSWPVRMIPFGGKTSALEPRVCALLIRRPHRRQHRGTERPAGDEHERARRDGEGLQVGRRGGEAAPLLFARQCCAK